ncbi:hypothetical protein PV326_013822 [Microctonus aethiopoides]|nr:hypothetical protein PV326_013822 [Microctonus aethiopoides]
MSSENNGVNVSSRSSKKILYLQTYYIEPCGNKDVNKKKNEDENINQNEDVNTNKDEDDEDENDDDNINDEIMIPTNDNDEDNDNNEEELITLLNNDSEDEDTSDDENEDEMTRGHRYKPDRCEWTDQQKVIYFKELLRGSANLFTIHECREKTWKALKMIKMMRFN